MHRRSCDVIRSQLATLMVMLCPTQDHLLQTCSSLYFRIFSPLSFFLCYLSSLSYFDFSFLFSPRSPAVTSQVTVSMVCILSSSPSNFWARFTRSKHWCEESYMRPRGWWSACFVYLHPNRFSAHVWVRGVALSTEWYSLHRRACHVLFFL